MSTPFRAKPQRNGEEYENIGDQLQLQEVRDLGIKRAMTIQEDNAQPADRLEVGGVMINEIPTFRVDQMPYGGVKKSGMGREGLKYAMEEMTEMKLISMQGSE